MKRRDFLKKLASGTAVAGTAGLAACGSAEQSSPAVHTGKRVRWRLASSFPRFLDTLFGGAEVLSERVSAMTGGQFEIRVYPAGEVVPGLQVMDAVQQRTVEACHTASYYYIGKNPALAFDCCVPFGLTARQQTAWLLEGGGLELMRGFFSDYSMLNFPGGNTGVQMGGWFKEEIGGLADLKGLKMRIPGLGGKVMDALEVSVQVIPGGEIYMALERGALDATEWVGPYDDEKLGFHKIAKNYYYPGWWEPGPNLSFYVGQEAWGSLPAAYKEVFQTATREAAAVMQAQYDVRNAPALKRILEAGVTLRPFTDDIMFGARAATQQILEEQAAADPAYAKLYKQWSAARKDMFSWFSTSELAYAKYAFPSGA